MPNPKSKPKKDRIREERIEMDIVVDAYDASERAMGWYCYLEDSLAMPFEARIRIELPTSPLNIGDKVEVLGLAPAQLCETDMFVWVRWPKRNLAVPLTQLVPLVNDALTVEAVADWHYWVDRGYAF